MPTDGLVAWFDLWSLGWKVAGNLELTLHGAARSDVVRCLCLELGLKAVNDVFDVGMAPLNRAARPDFRSKRPQRCRQLDWTLGRFSTCNSSKHRWFWNHKRHKSTQLDLWGPTICAHHALEYSQEEFDVAFWSKANGNFSADNILLGLNDQILGGADLQSSQYSANQPVCQHGGRWFSERLMPSHHNVVRLRSRVLDFDRALDVEDIQLFRSNASLTRCRIANT